jgi:hypothetical protein
MVPVGRSVFLTVGLTLILALTAWPDSEQDRRWVASRRNYWAFQQPVRPEPPQVKSPWVRTPIDAFILEGLQAKKLSPSQALDSVRLVRRIYLDLTGLPPTPGEVDQFLADRSPDAYEKLVNRLMTSPHYGERWAQRWLDVVRYADTNGYELDAERPHAWRYRDYVTRSFNQDKPYDRFVKEQIAGDELWPLDNETLIATGFHRAGPIHLVGGNQDEEMNRQEVLSEMTGAVGSVFLGMTVGCAKCHNHKFDPIPQADYYRLQAVFASTEGRDIDIATDAEKAAYEVARKAFDARYEPIKKALEELQKPYKEKLRAEKKLKLEPKLREALDTPKEKRTAEQNMLAKDAMSQINPSWDEVLAILNPEDLERRAALRKQMHRLELDQPDPPPTAYAVANLGDAPPTHILKVGDHKHKLDEVKPGFLQVIAPDLQVTEDACSRRSALAKWLASPDHPLTARVMVNRIWQFRMGTGIVRTPNDFGVLGERPTNPRLLDWLATEFIARNWSVKALDRMILTSSVYMQSAQDDPQKSKVDADNKLYWRANRRRLEGEAIRDSVLAVTGLLNPVLYGKPVRVPIEKEVYDLIFTEYETDNLWPLSLDKRDQYRRSLYLLNKRTVRLPLLANFDQPDAMTSCPVRPTSTHSLQALTLMNSDFMQEQSNAFADRLQRECASDEGCRLRRAYKLTLARAPRTEEVAMAQKFFSDGGTWQEFCLALLNRNEFVYLP